MIVSGARNSLQLFTVGADVSGEPTLITPASFQSLGAREVQELERWLKARPEVMGEDLKIVGSQFAGFDRTLDRLDLLALDRQGKLVVVEIKRDESSNGQDLQALRYAAYVSTLTAEQVVGMYQAYEAAERQRELTTGQARAELEEWTGGKALDPLDEDAVPRIVLVAAGFPVGVTNTVLWLTRNFDMDITCVQVTPYTVAGEIVLAASVLIPLPEAAAFEVRLKEKQRTARRRRAAGNSIDFAVARAFIAAIPTGRWASYGDVAAAAGAPKGGQALGTWLARMETDVPSLVYRVLNRLGEVSPGWRSVDPALPPTPEAVRERLVREGVRFDAQDRASPDQRFTTDDWATLQPPESSES
ncbi:hypothetical protein GKE82_24090 [Conexibacter sp. W3-3-2]|uniref:MGMT family protein n=1 Tax=Conexibacter sp. W3-3-2 TaxID=2675227 RepID=UPI0012B81E21|nr:MGMT family protein [Conexibacter sp. W3-3-2]MTD47289.1 hypothetical protein [Conexibacter sp. W3-3-2]